jgi:PD-(D/E)XK nuclease superfamily
VKETSEISAYELNRKALEALVVDNVDLERLEALLDVFNIFEAIGAVRQELRHSDFLAFLLDPQQNHGLGDAFLKKLLQKVLVSASITTTPITPIDLDVWTLDQILVLREWRNIDILLIDESHKLVIILENKIDTGEHSDQLRRYYLTVQQHFPGRTIIGLFLTPEGEMPSYDAFLPVEYRQICNLLESLAESRASTLGAEVLIVIRHYTQMLRRYIMSESQIIELSQRIYRKHRRALDLIYEHRPDRQAVIRDILEGLIKQTPDLVLDKSNKTYIRFTFPDWDIPALLQGKGWTPSGRILLFEFANAPEDLKIKLMIGPGPQDIRQKLYELALHNQPLFKTGTKALGTKWSYIYLRSFLTSKSYDDISDDELAEQISKHWNSFVQSDLKVIRTIVREHLSSWYSTDTINPL